MSVGGFYASSRPMCCEFVIAIILLMDILIFETHIYVKCSVTISCYFSKIYAFKRYGNSIHFLTNFLYYFLNGQLQIQAKSEEPGPLIFSPKVTTLGLWINYLLMIKIGLDLVVSKDSWYKTKTKMVLALERPRSRLELQDQD